MFNIDTIESIPEGVALIQKADSPRVFQDAIRQVLDYLQKRNYDKRSILENEYSQKDTEDRLKEAKKKVLDYINDLMDDNESGVLLLKVLNHFHYFVKL